jgi:hypothetical protein
MKFNIVVKKPCGTVETIKPTTEVPKMTSEIVANLLKCHAIIGNEVVAIYERNKLGILGQNFLTTIIK